MPEVSIVIYKEADGTVPLFDWMDRQPAKVQKKCRAKLGLLHELGNELRRPNADILRDGIWELRIISGNTHYRILYFYHGKKVVVISHGTVKQSRIFDREIKKAIERKKKFIRDAKPHTHGLWF